MKKQKNGYFKSKIMNHYLLILLCFGILTGMLLSYYIEGNDQSILKAYFQQPIQPQFTNVCFQTFIAFLSLLLCSTTILGPLFISFLIFSKGVQAGFSSLLFMHTYGSKGLLGILLTLIPPFCADIIWIMILGGFCIHFSILLFQCCITIKKIQWKSMIHPFLNTLLSLLLYLIFISYLEVTLFQQLSLLFQEIIT